MRPTTFNHCEPITEDDQTIATALQEAHVPSLMLALVHLTGDLSILRSDIHPSSDFFTFLADPQAGITPEQQTTVRAQALDVLKAYRDRGRACFWGAGAGARRGGVEGA